MAWSQDDVDAIQTALASGVLVVKYSSGNGTSREVTYQSTDQLLKLLALAQQSVNRAAGTATYRVVATKDGFE